MRRCWHFLWTILVCVALFFGTVHPARAQNGGLDSLRQTVQTWLLTQIGNSSLILVSYTYVGATWPDHSMGCPVADTTYQQGTVHGYNWTFEFSNQVSYEVHSDLEGDLVTLCAAENVADGVRLLTFRTAAYTIDVPESWLVFQTTEEARFGPSYQAACDQPGMRVFAGGQVASGVTPDQLLEARLVENEAAVEPDAREDAGDGGRSATYLAACDDEFMRHWRVTVFSLVGMAYYIEQWAPAAEAEKWDVEFLAMLEQFGVPDSITPAVDNPVTAADPSELPPLPLAHMFLNDVFLGALNDIPGRSVTRVPTFERRHLSFSPNGLFIAYTNISNAQLRAMNVVEGLSARKLADSVDPFYPPAWQPDSQHIAYVVRGDETESGTLLEVWSVPPLGGDAEKLGTFTTGEACSTDGGDVADTAYLAETGGDAVFLWLSDMRFLASTGCVQGISLIDLASGTAVPLGVSAGALSPDRARFAARLPGSIAVLDLETFQVQTMLQTDAAPVQIAWAADGSAIYYTTETSVSDVALEIEQEVAEAEFGYWPLRVAVNDVSLVQVDLASGTNTPLWTGRGRGIGRVVPTSGGVAFTLVPAGTLLADALLSEDDAFAVEATRPEPQLYWLAEGAEAPQLLAYAGQPAFAPVTVAGP